MSSTRPCRSCGAMVPEENQFCTACGTPVSFRPPPTIPSVPTGSATLGGFQQPSPPPPSAFPTYASTPATSQPVSGIGVTPTAPDEGLGGITLAHGEVVKRVYELGRIQRMWGWVQGTLVVTDTRVLYRAEAVNKLNRSTLNREIHLKDVRGVGLATRKGMSAAGLGAWLFGTLVSFFVVWFIGGAVSSLGSDAYGTSSGGAGWRILYVVIWLAVSVSILILRRRASVVVLAVFSNDAESSPISVTGVVGKSGGHGFLARVASPLIVLLEWLGIIEAGAAAESADIGSVRQVYAELGAVILDLQSRGTLGAD